jgi:hypothetical protein
MDGHDGTIKEVTMDYQMAHFLGSLMAKITMNCQEQ